MKTAFITGISGQDGAYLAEYLLNKDYKVIGLVRNQSEHKLDGLVSLQVIDRVEIVSCDLMNISNNVDLLKKYQPQEIYNLAAQSSVATSFASPKETYEFNINSVICQLEAIRTTNSEIKFYQASSSEMYGKTETLPVTEKSPLNPASPYGISKAASHLIAGNYREIFGLYVCCGILFNHESPLRGENFIIKKLVCHAIDIVEGSRDVILVGNLDVVRDFGYSPKYVEAIYLMMQNQLPSDYMICSGEAISLHEISHYILKKLGIEETKLVQSEKLFRKNDIPILFGDNTKARTELKWEYTIPFFDVLDIMIDDELRKRKL